MLLERAALQARIKRVLCVSVFLCKRFVDCHELMKARVFLLICRSVEMSSCLSNIAFKRGISTSSCLFRYATTNPEGRWIKDKTKKNTVLPWMITHKKGMEKARHDYNRIKDFDYMTSDVEQAKLSAITELEKLGKKIEDRGYVFCF